MAIVYSNMRCRKCGKWYRLLWSYKCESCGSIDLVKEEDE